MLDNKVREYISRAKMLVVEFFSYPVEYFFKRWALSSTYGICQR